MENQNILVLSKSEKPVTLEVEIEPKNRLQKILIGKNWLKSKKHLEIYTLKLATVHKICSLLLSIDSNLLTSEATIVNSLEIVRDHKDSICKIIAIAIKNSSGRYSRRCKRFIKNQFTVSELAQTMLVVIQQMHLPLFIQSVCFMRGIDINNPNEKQN